MVSVDEQVDALDREADRREGGVPTPPIGDVHLPLAQDKRKRQRWMISLPGTHLCGTSRCVPARIERRDDGS